LKEITVQRGYGGFPEEDMPSYAAKTNHIVYFRIASYTGNTVELTSSHDPMCVTEIQIQQTG